MLGTSHSHLCDSSASLLAVTFVMHINDIKDIIFLAVL